MQYLLTEEEHAEYQNLKKDRHMFDEVPLNQLRKKILKEAKFTCWTELPEPERLELERMEYGYCGACPLSFCHPSNRKYSASHRFCEKRKFFSK